MSTWSRVYMVVLGMVPVCYAALALMVGVFRWYDRRPKKGETP